MHVDFDLTLEVKCKLVNINLMHDNILRITIPNLQMSLGRTLKIRTYRNNINKTQHKIR